MQRWIRRAALGSVALVAWMMLATGCGADRTSANGRVEYDGDLLRVDGVDYMRQPVENAAQLRRGRVLVTVNDPDRIGVTRALLAEFELPIAGLSKDGVMLVDVPEGFEHQWQQVFAKQLPRAIVDVESILFPVHAVPPAPPAPEPVPVPVEEPSERVLRDLMFETYAELERMGGLPLTMTATGKQFRLRAKLHDARKEDCKPSPQRPAGEYECTMEITVGICADDCDPALETPSDKSERIGVKWDPSGRWVRQ